MNLLIVLFTIAITIGAYAFSRFLSKRYPHPLVNVVFLSTALIIIVLLISGISFEQYQPGLNIMTFLLGPATAALAIPLYRNREVLIKNFIPIVAGIVVGASANMITTVLTAKLLGLSKVTVVSLAPKSVTVPIAVSISKILNGDPSLTSVFVIATGILGTVLTPVLLNLFKVTNPLARGIAYGTTAHGQGTATALLEGPIQGSMSGVAMGLAAIYTSFVAPLLVRMLVG
ncbi:LrgB family protein [Desulfosporosinus sp. BG]|uniref:LrgB family protein n=1 Tax=Desulfosporosinus sp. BG TaxID=1633135 RepID=UPI000839E175|nr:LrgB family protein [Desulfosporosinus sp. BG]ODA42977.1 CidA-associated membrane protein CidB [Desulfosporosinus sp. BG]